MGVFLASMFRTTVSSVLKNSTRSFSASTPVNARVAVLGAAGGIGQPLSLLLKNDSAVSELNIYDLVGTPGVAADLSHISSPAKVTGFIGKEQLNACLKGCDVVVIPAGVPRKPGMTRDDLFNTNAGIVASLAQACAESCPKAHILVISNPVNSTVPIVAEVMKKAGVYDPKRVFGVTTLDVTRARTFVAEKAKVDVNTLNIPVVGGHAGTTIIPLLSQNSAGAKFSQEDIAALTNRIQFGGDEVVKAKDGTGSATLSMAYAGAQFTIRLLAALRGESNVVECTYVESSITDSPYFASPVLLGKNGVEEVRGYGNVTDYEKSLIDAAVPDLIKSIEKGIAFAKKE